MVRGTNTTFLVRLKLQQANEVGVLFEDFADFFLARLQKVHTLACRGLESYHSAGTARGLY